jgi:hypothetical protein
MGAGVDCRGRSSVPTFCRHNRFLQNCPICSREAEAAARVRAPSPAPRRRRARAGGGSGAGSAVRIRRAARSSDDGYRDGLAPGLRVRGDAERLAGEIGFAAARLVELAGSPPGLFAHVAGEPDLEEATWLAFLIAYLSPVEGDEPFAFLEGARTTWSSGRVPELENARGGPRSAHDPQRGAQTLAAYRRWAERAGSQAAAFGGEEHWTPQRRFARAFERLALPGLHRSARFDLLVTLGRTGRYELRADSLLLGGTPARDDTAVAAKRVFGIADALLIDRRAAALAEACDVPLEALDLALFNWQRGPEGRATLGAGAAARADTAARDRAAAALGV